MLQDGLAFDTNLINNSFSGIAVKQSSYLVVIAIGMYLLISPFATPDHQFIS